MVEPLESVPRCSVIHSGPRLVNSYRKAPQIRLSFSSEARKHHCFGERRQGAVFVQGCKDKSWTLCIADRRNPAPTRSQHPAKVVTSQNREFAAGIRPPAPVLDIYLQWAGLFS